MASDEIVWQVINQQFCSFKLKLSTKTQTFCRNEHNLTGFCSRQSCPLANSRYATVRPDPDSSDLYLYIKSAERAHLPSQWWERIRLPHNYAKALAHIDAKLIHWPAFILHKCKQRLTRLTQVAMRSRRLAREDERLGEKVVPKLAAKVKRREETRERKAERAAKVERAIERELVERLRSGAYGERPLNVEEDLWRRVLKGLERGEGKEEDQEEEEGEEAEEAVGEVEYVSDLDEEEMEGEMEDFEDWLGDGESAEDDDGDSEDDDGESQDSDEDSDADHDDRKPDVGAKRKRPAAPPPIKPRKKPARVEIEYETEVPQREALLA